MPGLKSLLLFVFSFPYSLLAQDMSLYQKKYFAYNNDTMPYRLLLPVNYDASKKYPLILFLHGAGERGNDNEAQLTHGSKLFLNDSIRQNYPAIVVFPQCSKDGYWSNVYREENATDRQRYTYRTDGDASPDMNLL